MVLGRWTCTHSHGHDCVTDVSTSCWCGRGPGEGRTSQGAQRQSKESLLEVEVREGKQEQLGWALVLLSSVEHPTVQDPPLPGLGSLLFCGSGRWDWDPLDFFCSPHLPRLVTVFESGPLISKEAIFPSYKFFSNKIYWGNSR